MWVSQLTRMASYKNDFLCTLSPFIIQHKKLTTEVMMPNCTYEQTTGLMHLYVLTL